MRRSHSGPGPEPSAPDWCHHRRSHGQLSRFSQGPDPGRARSGRTRSGQQDRPRSRGNLSSARQGAGAHLVQRTSRRHHPGGRGRRDAHRRQPRGGRFRPPELSRGRQPRRLFRRWRVAKDRSARLQDHRRPGLHHRVRREVADRIGRHPEDALLLCRRRRTQGLREVVSDDRTRRDLRELHQPVRRRRVGRTSRAGAGGGALPELHLPRQPHADNRIRLRPPPRKSRRHRELSLRRQHRQPRSRLRRDAGRGGVSRRARIRRLERVRGLECVRQQVHLHRQLERRRRQRHRKHVRRQHLLEEHARRRYFSRGSLRARYHGWRRRARLVHSRRGQRPARNDRQRIEHARSPGSTIRCPVRSAGAPISGRRIPACEGSIVRAEQRWLGPTLP